MTPEEREHARMLKARGEEVGSHEVDMYWLASEQEVRVEVLPRDPEEMPFGLRVLKPEAVNEVFEHPCAQIGETALRGSLSGSHYEAA